MGPPRLEGGSVIYTSADDAELMEYTGMIPDLGNTQEASLEALGSATEIVPSGSPIDHI